jgi:CRISPR-associated protein Csy1
VKSLRDSLERIAKRTDTVGRRDQRAAMVDELVDILLICAAEVQQLHAQRGWNAENELSFAEQLWLSPYRTELDEEFKHQRAKNGWQSDISRQFATWLNSRFSYKTTLSDFSDAKFQEWR